MRRKRGRKRERKGWEEGGEGKEERKRGKRGREGRGDGGGGTDKSHCSYYSTVLAEKLPNNALSVVITANTEDLFESCPCNFTPADLSHLHFSSG